MTEPADYRYIVRALRNAVIGLTLVSFAAYNFQSLIESHQVDNAVEIRPPRRQRRLMERPPLTIFNDPIRSYQKRTISLRDVALTIDKRIVGGVEAQAGAYPFYGQSTGTMLCGGTLVHEDVLLTAAHCDGTFVEDVILGSNDLFGRDGAERIPIEQNFPHPEYSPVTEENDIMLVKLSRPSSAPLVTWNTDPDLPEDGLEVTLIGFGQTQEGGNVSFALLEVNVNVVNWEACDARIANRLFEGKQLCGGVEEGGRDSCLGDSGGPMLGGDDNVQYGIVSFGFGCARPNTPAVYTRVSAYESWIRQGICDLAANPPGDCSLEQQDSLPPSGVPSGMPSTGSLTPGNDTSSMTPSGAPSSSVAPSVVGGVSDEPSDVPSSVPSSMAGGSTSPSSSSIPSALGGSSETPSDMPSSVPNAMAGGSIAPSVSAAPSDIASAVPSMLRIGGSMEPSAQPSEVMSLPAPSTTPSQATGTSQPTTAQTFPQTSLPTSSPTGTPTNAPTVAKTSVPTPPLGSPTVAPTGPPTRQPTVPPTLNPTLFPTRSPTSLPTSNPTSSPTTPTVPTPLFPVPASSAPVRVPSPTSVPAPVSLFPPYAPSPGRRPVGLSFPFLPKRPSPIVTPLRDRPTPSPQREPVLPGPEKGKAPFESEKKSGKKRGKKGATEKSEKSGKGGGKKSKGKGGKGASSLNINTFSLFSWERRKSQKMNETGV